MEIKGAYKAVKDVCPGSLVKFKGTVCVIIKPLNGDLGLYPIYVTPEADRPTALWFIHKGEKTSNGWNIGAGDLVVEVLNELD